MSIEGIPSCFEDKRYNEQEYIDEIIRNTNVNYYKFLNYRLVQKLYEMPFNYKLRAGVTKAVFRDGLNEIFSEKGRNRYSKLGFATPEDQWINGS